MLEVIKETIIDSVKLLPFLIVTFILIELIEHKINNKKLVSKAGKFGPFIGGILGAIPQCGFSVSATHLYATKIITMGTLISIYLSTSDEMIPIMISEGTDVITIVKIIGIKISIGIIFGFIIDLIFKKKEEISLSKICEDEHCHCENGIFFSAIKHTIHIFLFIIILSFLINTLLFFIGEDNLSKIFTNNIFIGPFICSLFGLIPNCASSVVITELYLDGVLTLGSAMAGLLTGSGVALMVLFKINKNIKENIKIISFVYFIGVVSGIIINLLGL